MTKKPINEMTRKEILAVKPREDYRTPVKCDGFILIPTRMKHASGYNKMKIVAVDKKMFPICNCATSCDVINLLNFDTYCNAYGSPIPESAIAKRWHIDCLPKSGLLYFSTWDSHTTLIEADSSSVDIKGFVSQENI